MLMDKVLNSISLAGNEPLNLSGEQRKERKEDFGNLINLRPLHVQVKNGLIRVDAILEKGLGEHLIKNDYSTRYL